MLQVTWQNRSNQSAQIEQDKTQVVQILTIKAFNYTAQKEQGNHIEQQMGSIRMNTPMRNKTAILSTLQRRRPENQPAHSRLSGGRTKRHNTGDQNNGNRTITRQLRHS